VSYYTNAHSYSVAVGDFNNDARLDIVALDYTNNSGCILLQYNRGALTNEMTYASGGASLLRSIAVGDMNNDNRLDIIVANYGTDNVGILFGYGNSIFTSQMMIDMGSNSQPSSISISDFNGDSQMDIAVATYGSKNVAMLLGNGKGSFASQIDYGFGLVSAPFVIASGDFNNDNRSEIAVAYDDIDNVDILVAYNTGSFTNANSYSTGVGPLSVAVGDLNNDIYLDIVVANYGSNSLSVLLGYGNSSFANQMTYSTVGGPWSVTIGDLNNDIHLDLVVANYDSNTV
jgi:hypothetical protein